MAIAARLESLPTESGSDHREIKNRFWENNFGRETRRHPIPFSISPVMRPLLVQPLILKIADSVFLGVQSSGWRTSCRRAGGRAHVVVVDDQVRASAPALV
jgi:hypothetical protein